MKRRFWTRENIGPGYLEQTGYIDPPRDAGARRRALSPEQPSRPDAPAFQQRRLMTNETEAPDLTEIILDGWDGGISDASFDRLKAVAVERPSYVAYFATGSLDDAESSEELYALIALLKAGPAGAAALLEALEDIAKAPSPPA